MHTQSPTKPIALQAPTDNWYIRLVLPSDAPKLRKAFWSKRSETYARDKIRRVQQAMSQQRGLGIVVTRSAGADELLAYGQYLCWTRCAEISDLIVAEAYRSQGIGTVMIQYLTRFAVAAGTRCVEIGAARSNPRAVALYRRLGFVDKQTVALDVGQGVEPVIYLGLDVPEKK